MAATVIIVNVTGAGAASADVTSGSVTAGTSDEATSPSAIPIPSSGSNHSYWQSFHLVATAAPDNAINNQKFYTDGTNTFGTGVTAIIAEASGYVVATGAAGSSGSVLVSGNHAGLTNGGATSDLFLYTSSCKLPVAGSIAATTGCIGDEHVITQLSVISTAGAGNSGEETMTWEFDET